MEIDKFINGKVSYDKEGQYFWIHGDSNGIQMLAELRGFGAIQNMFVKKGIIDMDAASLFQDEIGKFIAEAINEKMQRSKQIHSPNEKDSEIDFPDIRNKLTPFKNLIALLKDANTIFHTDERIQDLIEKEIEQCNKNIEYLSNRSNITTKS